MIAIQVITKLRKGPDDILFAGKITLLVEDGILKMVSDDIEWSKVEGFPPYPEGGYADE
jgi:hypothetical protein